MSFNERIYAASFFPRPKLFFGSVLCGHYWLYCFGILAERFRTTFGFEFPEKGAPPVIGLGHFSTPDFLWFYIYYLAFTFFVLRAVFFLSSHLAALVNSWFSIRTVHYVLSSSRAVAVNNWYRPFYDAIQVLSDKSTTTAADSCECMFSFLILAMTYV